MAPEMLLPVAPVLLQLSLSTSPLAPLVAPSRAGHCVALAKRGSKRTGGGGGFGAKRPQRPGGGGGFGALPPTLEEVVAGFKTRLPEDASVDCPCGKIDATGAPMSYEACCQPCHAGLQSGEGYPMESPEHCLRCRFSAFAYRLPLPIIATTHSDNRDYRTDRVAWVHCVGIRGRARSPGLGLGLGLGVAVGVGVRVGSVLSRRLRRSPRRAPTRRARSTRTLYRPNLPVSPHISLYLP